MHAPLHKPSTESACGELIDQLEACHQQWKKFWGGCNTVKIDLSMCLRQERLERTKKNKVDAQARQTAQKEKYADLLADD